MYDINQLKRRAEEIRVATLVGENTAERVGSLLYDMLDYLLGGVDERFLSRLNPDQALGLIKLLAGAEFGVYEPTAIGGVGKGGYIGPDGSAELKRLVLREGLEAPEYRFNRIAINVGNDWRAPGGGIIEEVIPDKDAEGNELPTGVIVLHLEEGEIGKVAYDDICHGIYHDGMTFSNNDSEDYDDGRGNFRFGGFFTSYFRITELLNGNLNNGRFRYALRNDDEWKAEHHPCQFMHFVCYGNFSNKERQVSRYSALKYERYLFNVNTWTFTAANIAAQFGDLDNLKVLGLNMDGYSAYLNNIYMTGTIQELDALPRMEIKDSGDGFLAYGESCTVTCTILRGWKDITDTVTRWKVERDTGSPADDAVWNNSTKAQEFDGSIVISYTEEENDLSKTNRVLSTLFMFTAYGEEDVELAKGTTTI